MHGEVEAWLKAYRDVIVILGNGLVKQNKYTQYDCLKTVLEH